MTNGQIAKLRELSKCWFVGRWDSEVITFLHPLYDDYVFCARDKRWLRSLLHKYRHQIKAMKRNRRD